MKFLLEQELYESKDLYKGIFWIVDLDNIWNNKDYCFQIESDLDGNTIKDPEIEIKAKSGTTYNHKAVWDLLDNNLTNNQSFDYYPRGRVQIRNSKADIYLNPNINIPEVQQFIVNQFNLNEYNGIIKIRFISDGAEHYKCYLD